MPAVNPGQVVGFFKNFGNELKEIFNWTKGVSKELMGTSGAEVSSIMSGMARGSAGPLGNASRYTTGMLRTMGYGAAGGAATGAIYGAGESMMDQSGSKGLLGTMAKRAAGFGLVGGIGGGLLFSGTSAWNKSFVGRQANWFKKGGFTTIQSNSALDVLKETLQGIGRPSGPGI